MWILALAAVVAGLESGSLMGCAASLPSGAAGLSEEGECVARESEGVLVLGQVLRPGRFPAQVAPTVARALDDAGGFAEIAWPAGVTLRRCGRVVRVDVEAILEGEADDVALRNGDVLTVPLRE